ncbi:cell number regulator 8 isoform X1 [Physcomitrium patens]|uniref:PLAC8 family protein n=2 Tax=Physcomitrium patens TaxID=3218 RepID=A0A7I4D274_PHYPA|nr:cell number regulator 8-like isoform X1 [Physcomitrium patens]|eukprot:XP_024365534.1 cell number regulator 8-like isoform X1 [Physcomitrella patens]
MSVTKMNKDQEQALAEQEGLLDECKLYRGEKEPDTKEPLTQEDEEDTVTGLPVGPGPATTVVSAQMPRTPWSTGLFQCLGNGDGHFSSDLEVCVLGFAAPCVLYGSNMERLYPAPRVFVDHCLHYSWLYFLGSLLFNANNIAPWSSVNSRVALRQKYNLEGYGNYCLGCCANPSEETRERCDSVCDLFIHGLFCLHPFALAQEARELRRRTLHPANQPYLVITMAPPTEQSMSNQI